eukprot:TRINITY_DN104798_c0_g1_i1.p1 TRINITY_DN104798_c0_g1~~TRINITY_DN104798_c0_g1_i1.p1  ORF type:complete len:407 (-),score=71.06 TRINITY_DN104798_c0_g1_i1:75-1295(-)
MPVHVTLSSGRELAVQTAPGELISALRVEIARILDTKPGDFEISQGGTLLEEEDKLADGAELMVVLRKLPWLDPEEADPAWVQDLGGGECGFVDRPKTGDSPIVALCDVAFMGGAHYFELEVLHTSGNIFVGVTTKAGFKSGYKLKGLMYGGPGNLSGGSCLLRAGFGQQIKSRDVIGVQIQLEDPESVSLSIWHNGNSLGVAFAGCKRESGTPVFPVVSCQDAESKLRLSLRHRPRTTPPPSDPPLHHTVGSWRMVEFIEQGTAQDLDSFGKGKGKGKTQEIGLRVKPGPTAAELSLSIKVGNQLMTSVKVSSSTNEASTGYASQADGTESIAIGPVLSTQMAYLGNLAVLEQLIAKVLPTFTQWRVADAGTDTARLHFQGPACSMVFEVCSGPSGAPVDTVTLP